MWVALMESPLLKELDLRVPAAASLGLSRAFLLLGMGHVPLWPRQPLLTLHWASVLSVLSRLPVLSFLRWFLLFPSTHPCSGTQS